VCCRVLQCVAECCSVLQCVVVCCNVCCSMLQCIAACCRVLTNVQSYETDADLLPVCCSVLQKYKGRKVEKKEQRRDEDG